MGWRTKIALAAGVALVLAGVAAAAGWMRMRADLELEGGHVGSIGCIVEPYPELDWGAPGLRRFVWSALRAPDWMLGERASEVREGAVCVLQRSARAADEEAVLRLALEELLTVHEAGLHLGLAWVAAGRIPPHAKPMLAGRGGGRALALVALAVATGRRIEAVEGMGRERWTIAAPERDARLAWFFGAPPDALAAEWIDWLSANGERPIAELQREWIRAALLEAPVDGPEPLGARVAETLCGAPEGEVWRAAVGAERLDSSDVWWSSDAERRQRLAERLRDAPAPAVPVSVLEHHLRHTQPAMLF